MGGTGKEWETTRDSEGLGRLERPTRPGEVHSREKKRAGDYKRQ